MDPQHHRGSQEEDPAQRLISALCAPCFFFGGRALSRCDLRAHLPGRLKSNGKGTPQIDLNEWALGALRRIRKSGWTREVVKGANLSVFRGEDALRDSDFVSPFVTAEEAVERACERLGFEKQSPHKLRHFFGSECAEQGDSWPIIAQALGHTDGGTLAASLYTHVRRGHSAERARKWTLDREDVESASRHKSKKHRA